MARPRLAGAILALFRWRKPVPAIARGLPPNYTQGTKELCRRVEAGFPVGTPEEDLIAALRAQGFAIGPPRDGVSDATFERTDLFVFRTIWSVRWRAEQGRVTGIWGVYGVQAP